MNSSEENKSKRTKGKTSLAEAFPDIAQEWDHERNGFLVPELVAPHSSREIWWLCAKEGHSWCAKIGNRTKENGSGCPVCAGRKVLREVNDLRTLCPDLIAEWDFEKNTDIDPTEIRPGANLKVWWRCENCGHEWMAKVQSRALQKSGCPMCADKRKGTGISNLQEEYPDIVKDWDAEANYPLLAQNVRFKLWKKVGWHCHKCGGKWQETIAERVRENEDCPYCTDRKVLEGVNDLVTRYPVIAAQWDEKNGDLRPEQFLPKSSKRVIWRCDDCGESWDARICDRVRYNTGCPYCAGKRVIPGKTDLASKYPELAAQWDYERNKFSPTEITAGSGKRVFWRCHICGESWETSISSRVYKNTGCPFCSGLRPKRGVNDFATLHADLLTAWDPVENSKKPWELTEKSNYIAHWVCSKGHKWTASVKSRVLMKSGCPFCSGRIPVVGETDLATVRPDLAAQWDVEANGCDAETVTRMSGKKVCWCCINGHKWRERVATRSRRPNARCPYCENTKRGRGGESF